MAESPEFGNIRKIRKSPSDGVGRPFYTYELDKRQSMAVSAKLNTAMLMRVIDRWQELEEKKPELPQNFSQAQRLAADLEKENENSQSR